MARKMIDVYRAELYEVGKLRRMARRLGPKRLAELRAELVGDNAVWGTGRGYEGRLSSRTNVARTSMALATEPSRDHFTKPRGAR
jgi:hypothetical protein